MLGVGWHWFRLLCRDVPHFELPAWSFPQRDFWGRPERFELDLLAERSEFLQTVAGADPALAVHLRTCYPLHATPGGGNGSLSSGLSVCFRWYRIKKREEVIRFMVSQ
jgi:hypothetical protein